LTGLQGTAHPEKMSNPTESWRQAMAAGMGQTPYVAALGGETFAGNPGRVRMRLPYSQKVIGNPDTGVIHGGVITGFLDQCCGMAVGSALREPTSLATLDLRIDYMKPARPGADVWFEGECIKITHEVAFARARAYQETVEDPIALATGTFMFTRSAIPTGDV
jgi:uncharacterized protein (TIGR00369 family)